MKKYLLLLAFFVCAFASCKKGDDFDAAKQAAEDDAQIKSYIELNGLTAEKDPSGLYYAIIEPGFDITPTLASSIKVSYTGKLITGEQFDQGSNVQIRLSNTIKGWQIGIPKIKKGGRIILLVPSGLAYGQSSADKIPSNSVLLFNVDLIDVN